jgi:hypothetical protein
MPKNITVEEAVWEALWRLKRKWKKKSLNAVVKELLVFAGETI